MKSLFGKEWRISALDKIESIAQSFSPGEKVFFAAFGFIFIASVFWILVLLSNHFTVEIPAHGGTLTEGIVGTPRFINPVLAVGDADRDIAALAYSGLMRHMPDGTLIPDLAESYTISADGLTYTFTLRPNAKFQDGTSVTSDDVAFTVLKVQDADLKSPEFANWNGVTVTATSSRQISFTLKQPYAFFLEDTTLGILPKHIWQNVTDNGFPFSTYNTNPVGSGPFEVSAVSRDSSGVPTQYALSAFNGFALGTPYLDSITIKFYSNENDLKNALIDGDIDSASDIAPEDVSMLPKTVNVLQVPLARVYGVFFNQNQNPLFADKSVRVALNMTAPKQSIVASVLDGFGKVLNGPLPDTALAAPSDMATSTLTSSTSPAALLLLKDGWKKSSTTDEWQKVSKKQSTPLSFSLSTADVPNLVSAAHLLSNSWNTFGAQVNVKVFDQNDLVQNVIEPRSYDALLFGMVVSDDSDLYAFWDSSQRNYPGLNIAEYTNAKADKALADLRTTTDPLTREKDRETFLSNIATDTPAVFLYAPDFIYAFPKDLQNVHLGIITLPADRFADVYQWYEDTERIWTIFQK